MNRLTWTALYILLLGLAWPAIADTPPARTINSETYDAAGNGINSTLVGGSRGLDCDVINPTTAPLPESIIVSGSAIDPRQIRALTTSDQVSCAQQGSWTVQQGSAPWSVSQSGTWTTGRTWDLSSGTDSVAAAQSGTWTVQQGSAPWSVSQSGAWTTGRTWTLSGGSDTTKAQLQDNAGTGITSTLIGGVHQAVDVNAVGVTTATVGDLMASGTITTTCSTPTTSCSAGSYVQGSINGVASSRLQIEGTFTGASLTVYGSVDGSNWLILETAVGPTGAYSTTPITATGEYRLFRIAGFTQLRVIATALSTGSVAVIFNSSIGDNLTEVVQQNPLNFIATTWLNDGSGNAISSTSGSLNVDVTNTVSASQSGSWTVQQGGAPWSVSQSGTWTTGRTWDLSSGTDSVAATQSGTWTVQQGAAPWSVSQSGTWSTRTQDGSGNAIGSTSGSMNVDVTNTVPVSESGTWTVQQGGAPWSVSQSGTWTTGRTWTLASGTDSVTAVESGTWAQNVTQFGGTNVSTGTGASGAGIPRVTVSNDSNVLATQSGAWTTGRTWDLASGTDSVSSVQSGTWTVQQGSAPWSVSQSGTWTVQQGSGPWTQNLTQVGGTAFALGQAVAAGSLPVVTQADTSPSTQTITVQDTGSTTTAQSNSQNFITGTPTAGSAASFAIASMRTVTVEVTGTWTGTIQTEVSTDNGVTWITRGLKQGSYLTSSFTGNVIGDMNASTMTNVRVRAVAAMTGTATVRITESVNESTIVVSNPLTLRDSTVQSVSDTIKAASTAALATDTSLVVAISPNSPVPPGSNNIGSLTNITGTVSLPTGAATATNQATMISDLGTISGQLPATLGQKTMANSMAVAFASNQTGLNNNQDASGTGTITAQCTTPTSCSAGSTVTATTNGSSTLQFNVTGTWSATMAIEGLDLNGNWVSISGDVDTTDTIESTFTVNTLISVAVAGFPQVRIRCSAYTSGTANVSWDASSGVGLVEIFNTNASSLFATVVGSVASGSADSGNPIKTGGKYNSTPVSLSNGNRSDTQASSDGSTIVAQRFTFRQQATAATVTLKSGEGILHTICLGTQVTGGIIELWDNTAASGTQITTITPPNGTAPACYTFDVEFLTGLTFTTTGTSNWMVSYR